MSLVLEKFKLWTQNKMPDTLQTTFVDVFQESKVLLFISLKFVPWDSQSVLVPMMAWTPRPMYSGGITDWTETVVISSYSTGYCAGIATVYSNPEKLSDVR